MKVFLAGNRPCDMNVFLVEGGGVAAGYFNNFMKIYLSGTERIDTDRKMISKSLLTEPGGDMRICQSGGQSQLKKAIEETFSDSKYSLYTNAKILQSFSYADELTEKEVIPKCSDFLLDSGACIRQPKTLAKGPLKCEHPAAPF